MLGILDCFPPDELSINWNGTPVDGYIRFMEQASPGFDYQGYEITQGEYPDVPESCDAYLITGSPKGVYDNLLWIKWLKGFILECYQNAQKMVGICFGHQILAHTLGGWAGRAESGWGLGLIEFDLNDRKPWMIPTKTDRCALHFVHQDQVQRLPNNATLIGSSHHCPNLIFEIENRAFGIQGHPEFTTDMMLEIIAVMEKYISTEEHKKAQDSVKNGRPDNALFARWITNFLSE